MNLRTLFPIQSSIIPWLLAGVVPLAIAVGLLVTDGRQAHAQDGAGDQREGYEKRLAARIARYQDARAARASETGRAPAELISDLASTLQTGGSDDFTVGSDGLDPASNYRYSFDIGVSGEGIGFDSSCSRLYETIVVPEQRTSRTSYEDDATLYACSRGDYTVTVRLYEYSVDEDETYELEQDEQTVTVVNAPPVFNPDTYSREVPENATSGTPVVTVLATDPDNDSLTYSITAGNTGSAFHIATNSDSITVLGTLDHGTTPSYSLTVQADDRNGGTDTATVSIAVTIPPVVNRPPVVAQQLPAITLAPSGGSSTDIDLSGKFSDPDDGDTLRYSASWSPSAVLASAIVSGSTLTLTPEASGTATVTVTAYDRPFGDSQGLNVSQAFNATVPEDEPPVFMPRPGQPGQVPAPTVMPGDASGSLDVSWVLPPNGAIPTQYEVEYWVTGNASEYETWYVISEPTRHTTITGLTNGTTYEVQILACIGTNNCSLWSPSGFGTPEAPEVINEAPTITGGSSFLTYAEKGTDAVETYVASDPNGNNISWTLEGDDSTSFRIGASSGKLTFRTTPDFEAPTDQGLNNTYNVTVVATDDGSPPLSSKRQVTIRVTNVNEPPEVAVAVPNQMLTITSSPVTVDLSDKFSDQDGDVLRYSASPAGVRVATISVSGATMTITPVGLGSTIVTVTAHDRAAGDTEGLSVSQDFSMTVAVAAPARMAAPTLTPGDGSLTVKWTTPYNGGAAITRYGIRYGEGQNPPFWTNITPPGLTTQYTIGPNPPLTNGSTYAVQVRACNGSDEADCGHWSSSQTGTPTDPRLAKPVNLDISPLPGRKALLTWTGDPNADNYLLDFTVPAEAGTQTVPRAVTEPIDPFLIDHQSSVARITLDLDNIVSSRDLGDLGLGNREYFKLRITAQDSTASRQDSEPSDEITIIDNPILRIEGYSPGAGQTEGKAKLFWPRVEGSNGRYEIRHRKLLESGGQVHFFGTGWQPDRFEDENHSRWVVDGNPDGERPVRLTYTLTDLTLREIFAVQLNYETEAGDKVFSARDAFVWPSNGFPNGGTRVATYPFFGHWPNGDYDFLVCSNTFPEGDQDEWVNLIKHAFEQWELAADGLVQTTPWPIFCPHRDNLAGVLSGILSEALPNIPVNPLVIAVPLALSEVYMVDTTEENEVEAGFTEFTSNPLALCVFLDDACVVSPLQYLNYLQQASTPFEDSSVYGLGVDVIINRARVEGEIGDARRLDIAGGDIVVTEGDTLFNGCRPSFLPDPDFRNYELMVHEAGHALGLSHILVGELRDEKSRYQVAHPGIADSVMNKDDMVFDGLEEPDCSPHPMDILAIYALYQSVGQ